jgi:hypothetical protein
MPSVLDTSPTGADLQCFDLELSFIRSRAAEELVKVELEFSMVRDLRTAWANSTPDEFRQQCVEAGGVVNSIVGLTPYDAWHAN